MNKKLEPGVTFRNMLGHQLTIREVGDDVVTFEYANGRQSDLPRSTVNHAIRTARWS